VVGSSGDSTKLRPAGRSRNVSRDKWYVSKDNTTGIQTCEERAATGLGGTVERKQNRINAMCATANSLL